MSRRTLLEEKVEGFAASLTEQVQHAAGEGRLQHAGTQALQQGYTARRQTLHDVLHTHTHTGAQMRGGEGEAWRGGVRGMEV